MTEKEKAKTYDEAIERAKKSYGNIIAEKIFPELKESEDERIKKAIIEFFESEDDNTTYSLVQKKDIIAWLKKQVHLPKFTFDDVLALQCCMETVKKVQEDKELYEQLNLIHDKIHDAYWLEKQGENSPILFNSSNTGKNEQNSTDKIEPRFKVGDWIVDNCGYIWKIERILNQFYLLEDTEGGESLPTIDWVDDAFHLWTIQDVKDGDVICYRDEISLYKNEIKNCNKQDTTFGGFVYYCCYDGKRFITNSFYLLTGQDEIDVYPATKEQRDALMKAINNVGYEWDTEKKELKKRKLEI